MYELILSHIASDDRSELSMTLDATTLMAVLEQLPDEVYLYNADTLRCRYLNQVARVRNGWLFEDITNRHITDTFAAFDINDFRRHVAPLLEKREDTVTLEFIHPDGPLEVCTRLVACQDGSENFLSVVRDVTKRKNVEAAKLLTVSTVSHELRSPLTSIRGALKLLEGGVVGKLDEATQQVIEIASRNTDRLLNVVDDILDFEKIQGDRMDFSVTNMDLVCCVEETLDLMTGMATENEVQIELESNVRSAIVTGNEERIGQVVTNFLSNAIKYSPRGETVTLGLHLDNDGLKVFVMDRGPGISDDQRQRLFQPFSQALPSDGKKRPGTGLGLAIVASILQRLEYDVDFQSEVGAGSTFAFRIPDHLLVSIDPVHQTQADVG